MEIRIASCYKLRVLPDISLRTEQQGLNPIWAVKWFGAGWESSRCSGSLWPGMQTFRAEIRQGTCQNAEGLYRHHPTGAPCPWWVVRAASNQGKYGSSGSPNVLLDHLVSLDECCFRDSSCLDPSGDFVDGGLLTSCYLEVPAVAGVRGDSWSLFILQDGFLRVCQWYPNFRRSHLFI